MGGLCDYRVRERCNIRKITEVATLTWRVALYTPLLKRDCSNNVLRAYG